MNDSSENMAAGANLRKIEDRIKAGKNCHIMECGDDDYKDGAVTKNALQVITIIGEIEGHEKLPAGVKSTSYEDLLPAVAQAENCREIKGVLVLINTVGGDVESGLAISEMFASLSKPVVTLVLGGGHSIGVPLATSGDASFIVPTATMVVHPIRTSTAVLGVKQNFEYIEKMQDRIIDFTVVHSDISHDDFKKYMFNTAELTKDVGSVLVGNEAVRAGIITASGGMADALKKLYDLINCINDSKIP